MKDNDFFFQLPDSIFTYISTSDFKHEYVKPCAEPCFLLFLALTAKNDLGKSALLTVVCSSIAN